MLILPPPPYGDISNSSGQKNRSYSNWFSILYNYIINLNTILTTVTGTGSIVLQHTPTIISPILTTPNIGIATGTSLNLGGTTLTQYIAGAWTPIDHNITFSGGGSAVWQASYTRIGEIVLCTATLTNSNGGTSTCVLGTGSVTGLPVANSGTWSVQVMNQGTGAFINTGILNSSGSIFPPSWTTVTAVLITFYYLCGSS